MKKGLPQVNEHMVVVLSITYNQSKFIEDTLNGFAMQRTNFPFLCCIFDDASTDGEQDVLKRWIENHCNAEDVEIYDHPLTFILMAPDKDNSNCIYAIHLQKINTWGRPEKQELLNYWRQVGKYIALCEGDDYWIDSLKLQKQVDFLENNPSIPLCFCKVYNFIEKKNKLKKRVYFKQQYSFEDLLVSNQITTLSVMIRTDLYKKYKEANFPVWGMGDYPLWLFLTEFGNCVLIDRYSAVYRILSESASHSKDINKKISFIDSIYNIQMYFLRRANLKLESETYLKKKIEQKYYHNLFSAYFHYGKYNETLKIKMKLDSLSIKEKCFIIISFFLKRFER